MRLQAPSQNGQNNTEMALSPVCSRFCFVVQHVLHLFVSLDFGLHLNLQHRCEQRQGAASHRELAVKKR